MADFFGYLECQKCGRLMVPVVTITKPVNPPIHETRWKCFGCGHEAVQVVQQETPEQLWGRLNA